MVIYKRNSVQINGKKFVPFLDKSTIKKRIKELSLQIYRDYESKLPVFIVVLKGAIFFASELIQQVKVPSRIEILRARSYGNRLESSGNVELLFSNKDFRDENVIIVEDIIDTGLTMQYILEAVSESYPKSIEIATLLLKPQNLKYNLNIKYCGFEIPSQFVIGYGLDYAEFGRNLDSIYILEKQ
jgi:hypoxanthine phosphoribosyltransferase